MPDIRDMFVKSATNKENESSNIQKGQTDKSDNQTIEQTYQKKTQLEHILIRPDTYIGSIEKLRDLMWIYDSDTNEMVQRNIEYVPGLYKIFDEIMVNAADNKQRDPKMNCIKIKIDSDQNRISIWNNGKGIPVVMHKEEKMYVPTLIFGHLLTSSNYNDEEEKVTGGRNGYGAKLCNIFSTSFTIETASKEYGKKFKQTWSDNMSRASAPMLEKYTGEDFTKVTFMPDLKKFKMDKLDKGIVGLMHRRAYDVAATTRGVSVFLNDTKVPIKTFNDYVNLYVKDKDPEASSKLKVISEVCNDRWEVAITLSESGFQQMSFVNSIATTKGGRHVDYIVDMITKQLITTIKKKNKGGINVKPHQVKNHLWVFINCLIVNPTFDSQTKENMTLQSKSFGSKCALSEKFMQQVLKSGVVESVLQWAKFKEQTELNQKTSGKKQSKLKGIPKLEDANEAGTKNALKCTLILTEGDSAKSLAVSGLGVIGRDYYGVFPLKGKLLNVREATYKQILENQEINNLIKIIGLQYKKKYTSEADMKTLRYGKVMIMTDQDQDGSHIKGLLINFIHFNWPELLKQNFLEEFITPILKASKRGEVLSFYSIPEFEEWKLTTPNYNTYHIKYYKGLGTSTSQEAREYFSNMVRHRIRFRYKGDDDDNNILLAFSKKHVEQRKEWLTAFMTESKRRKEQGEAEQYLYTKNTQFVTYSDFVNLELVLFSNMDNVRSIPSLVDGLKPGQRKVMFTCFKRNDKREVKVAQLGASVAEHSAYHHGETSLYMTIVNLAQNFVGSNNINLLLPKGQFGTRLVGGKDSASPRYIFTKMSPLTRLIFHPGDDALLRHEYDDNQKIEPVWYIPILPMVLVNGAEGIGTGWMTKIPNYNPREIVENLFRMLNDEEIVPMMPWYKNFKGVIEDYGDQRYAVNGEIGITNNNKVEITELPIGVWTQTYKENILEPLLYGTEKTPSIINDYKEYNTDTTVKFVISLAPEKLQELERRGLHKEFKLQNTINTSCMCLFDSLGCIRKYESVVDILREFFVLRLEMYRKRKIYIEGMLEAEANKLSFQGRFIMEKCSGEIKVENKKRKIIVDELVKRGYPPDPVKSWKERSAQNDEIDDETENVSQDDEEIDSDTESGVATTTEQKKRTDLEIFKNLSEVQKYDYLLGMSMWMLTEEKKNELLRQRDAKLLELDTLRKKTKQDLWKEDLNAFLVKLDQVEQTERDDEVEPKNVKKLGKKKLNHIETMPSPAIRRIAPSFNEELKKKIQAATRGKERKEKKTVKKSNEDNGDEFDLMVQTKTLKEKLGTPESAMKKARTAKKVKDGLKQTKLNFDKATNKSKEDVAKSILDDKLEILSSSDSEEEIIVRSKRVKLGPAVPKYNFGTDDGQSDSSQGELGRPEPQLDDSEDIFNCSDDDDDDDDYDDYVKKPKSVPKAKQVTKQVQYAKKPTDFGNNDSGSAIGSSSAEQKSKSVPKAQKQIKKVERAKRPNVVDDQSDSDTEDSGDKKSKKRKAKNIANKKETKKTAVIKKKAKANFNSDSDSDFNPNSFNTEFNAQRPTRNVKQPSKYIISSDDQSD